MPITWGKCELLTEDPQRQVLGQQILETIPPVLRENMRGEPKPTVKEQSSLESLIKVVETYRPVRSAPFSDKLARYLGEHFKGAVIDCRCASG